ncbi:MULTISPECIES: DUF2829 domain-containing protein [unclassified Arcicella]|uniref:DUF2829 domain-containing protein n=1 Tax=unclassified Arcicella TaxID=2644986 RepID=UPI0028604AD7|nr:MULTISPECIES: DUF2829 domain-containing protein [unclassified Arcicella]MDR6564939.1 hypothetical protein [Arcicella sp. BE51]MDR6814729.1 hypothetical protein [Arcicella sp. BE140]MDR6826175.1 hypothetical protein [Arcicella sp. BE139]
MKTQNLTFGEAIELAKKGELITRSGWNGKQVFLFIRPVAKVDIELVKTLPDKVKTYYEQFKEAEKPYILNFTPYMCMKAADNTIVNGWLASQTDIISEDWQVFEV